MGVAVEIEISACEDCPHYRYTPLRDPRDVRSTQMCKEACRDLVSQYRIPLWCPLRKGK